MTATADAMSAPAVFLWNPGAFADQLRRAGSPVATSPGELRELRRQTKLRDSPLVVLAEWSPARGRLTDFEGLRFIVDLFESERQIPRLALCSFLSRRALAALGDERGEASRLMFPFVRLPATASELAEAAGKAKPVSQMVHVWLRDHVLSAHPFLMWEHNFRREANGELEGVRRALERLATKVHARRPALARTFKALSTFEQWISDGLQAVQNGDLRAAEEAGTRIQEHLRRAQHEAETSQNAGEVAPYSVIVVEDDAAQRSQIVAGLEPYFAEVFGFEEGGSALAELHKRNTEGRRFHGVVSDWDLRKGGETDGFMQPLQGPDVLLHAADLCIGPLVGLTSLPSDIVAAVLNAAPEDVRARLSWYPKHESGNGAVQNYQGLAHHILAKTLEALGFQDETPAQLGYAPWKKHGLGEHYVTVRMWSEARQQAFFDGCFVRAREILLAYRIEVQRQNVSEPPFSLAFNVPSGTRAESRYTFERFQDVLCGRLVVLALYGLRPRPERNYRNILSTLFPQMMEKARSAAIHKGAGGADPYPSSFKPMMAILGLPTQGHRIDLGKLRLMPHESCWLNEQALDLGLPPLLTADEQDEATDLVESIDEILARLREQLRPVVLDSVAEEMHDDPDASSLYVNFGEEAVATVEAAAKALGEPDWLDELPPETVRAAASLLKRELEFLTDDGVFEKLYRKLPSWKSRLNNVIDRLSD